jgi:cytoskeleton protein RodZ
MSEPAISGAPATPGSASSPAERPGAAGAALLGERRRQGLSLGDVSRQLKLSVRQVEALERDDYSAYKGPVFIHGFIRNYAKLLGLDPEPLIRATDSMLNPPPVVSASAPPEQQRPRPVRTVPIKRRVWPAVLTVLVVAIAMSVYFGGRRAPDAGRSAPSVAARDKPAPPPKQAAAARTGTEAKSKPESKAGTESAAVKAATRPDAKPETKTETKTKAETAGRAPVETAAANATGLSGRVTVRMFFEQESWVEIKDHAGNTIFGQLNAAGSRRSVSGEPPLSVVVGNAAGVRLFVGDKNIDLAPHTRVDVARLKLE